ncbi:SDR family oxidoreductase [Candidatus Saccharibacteria bacterium]|nr:SDR family oxidoreductase [Candidatus Saccharibacteria bacterium]
MRVRSVVSKAKRKLSVKEPVPYPILKGDYLKNRVAFITGGSSGIGFSIAESFLQNGASVVICGRNEEKLKAAKEKLEKVKADHATVDIMALDISKTEDIDKTVNQFLEKYNKKIDILVNNAGVSRGANIGATKIEDFEGLLKTNLEGTYFISQFFLNYMRENKIKGNILNIASASSLRPANSPYIIAKWGVAGLTKGLAKTGIKDNIVVNGLAPGPTATPMLVKNTSDIYHPTNPSGRYAMPEEIANLATILVSDMGRMIVGDTLYASGGAGVITFDDMGY